MNIARTGSPVDRSAYVPGKVLEQHADTTATYVNIAWDPSFFGKDRASGFALTAKKDGSLQTSAAWAAADFARDNVQAQLDPANPYQAAIVNLFTAKVAEHEAALASLQSNFPLTEKYQPKNGTFDFVYDRPGTANDLRYVGLIEAAPAPIRDILASAQGFQKYF